jgi:hypothetical protein
MPDKASTSPLMRYSVWQAITLPGSGGRTGEPMAPSSASRTAPRILRHKPAGALFQGAGYTGIASGKGRTGGVRWRVAAFAIWIVAAVVVTVVMALAR